MKASKGLSRVAVSLVCLLPAMAAAQEDDFGISEESAKKAAPAPLNFVEFGVGYNWLNNFRQSMYTGRTERGPFALGGFSVQYRPTWQDDTPMYARALGTDLGLGSRRFEAEGGLQGQYKGLIYHDEITAAYAAGKTPYNGVGGGWLSLPSNWPAGGAATPASFPLANVKDVELEQHRWREGLGLAWNPAQMWQVETKVEHEHKEGLKLRGIVWGGSSAGKAVNVPEPVDYDTDRVDVGLTYSGKRVQAQMGYQLSMFRNGTDVFTVQNPFDATSGNAATRNPYYAQLQLPPDNMAHQINLSAAADLGETTRLIGTVTHALHLQDQNFLPYAVTNQTFTKGLPLESLRGRVWTTVAGLELTTRPAPKVDLRARYRFTDRNNQTPQFTYQYARPDQASQGAAAATIETRTNLPYSFGEHLMTAEAGYRILPRTKLTLGHDFRWTERNMAEVDRNYENTARMQVRSNLSDNVTGTLKYGRSWRTGSRYEFDAHINDSFQYLYGGNSSNLNTRWTNNPLHRMYNQANRIKDAVSANINYTPSQQWTLGASGSVTLEDFTNSVLGVTDTGAYMATGDVNYTPTQDLSAYAFYSYERRITRFANWATNYTNENNKWWMRIKDITHTIGTGAKYKANERLAFDLRYSYSMAHEGFNQFRANISAANTLSPLDDVPTRMHTLNATATYELTDGLTSSLTYEVDKFAQTDWAYTEMSKLPSLMSMGELAPVDEMAHIVALTLKQKF